MAKYNLQNEIDALVASGDVVVSENNSFTATDGTALKVRSMEGSNDPLEIGEKFTIPTDLKVYQAKIGENTYPCTIVTVTGVDGNERAMRFFPNSLAKNVYPVDAEGRRMPKAKTTGTVAAEFKDFETVDEAMKAFAGKTILVANKTTYRVQEYQNPGNYRNTSIYEYNWAD